MTICYFISVPLTGLLTHCFPKGYDFFWLVSHELIVLLLQHVELQIFFFNLRTPVIFWKLFSQTSEEC
jgi:hypothetical protein